MGLWRTLCVSPPAHAAAAHQLACIPIFMEVTRWPQCFKMTPMLLAVTPLPSPLTTPPDTSTYFMTCSAHIQLGFPECCLWSSTAAAAQTQQGWKPHSMLRSRFLNSLSLRQCCLVFLLFRSFQRVRAQVVLPALFEREEAKLCKPGEAKGLENLPWDEGSDLWACSACAADAAALVSLRAGQALLQGPGAEAGAAPAEPARQSAVAAGQGPGHCDGR